jgi:hypothetical protein
MSLELSRYSEVIVVIGHYTLMIELKRCVDTRGSRQQ